MKISVTIGKEWTANTMVKGFCFIVRDGTEEHIYQSYLARQIHKERPIRIEAQGVSGSWTRYIFEIPEGTILKLYTATNWKRACGFFETCSKSPFIRVTGYQFHGNGGKIEGRLRWVPPGIVRVNPRQITWFNKANLDIKNLLQVSLA